MKNILLKVEELEHDICGSSLDLSIIRDQLLRLVSIVADMAIKIRENKS